MRLVSDQSGNDIALQRAAEEIDGALRELIANILRVSRGAGAPWKIIKQLGDLVQALRAQLELPEARMFDFEGCLRSIFPDDLGRTLSQDQAEWARGQEQMVRGAMQIVASRFLEQRTQEAAGRTEMFNGLATIEKLRDQNRRSIANTTSAAAKGRAAALMQEIRTAAQSTPRKPSKKVKPPSMS